MSKDIRVKPGPQEYICRVGAWDLLPSELLKRGLKKVLVLHGEASWKVGEKHFPKSTEVEFIFQLYRKPCSDVNINYFSTEAERLKVDGIVALGAGKVSDLAKAVAYRLQLPVIMLPTLASTCAAYTPLSVIYDDEGQLTRMDYYNRAIALTLVDPQIILDSPEELLVAGIGDTLAKWYEANAILESLEVKSIEVQLAHFAAKKCQEVLLAQSANAIRASRSQVLNQGFIDVVETIIMVAGMVGGFGDHYGRTSGAHALHDGLTLIPAAHTVLHGKIVAYSILVQLIMEDKWEEIETLIPFYREIGLGTSLTELNLDLTLADLEVVSKRAAEDEPIHLMAMEITPEFIFESMLALEKYRN